MDHSYLWEMIDRDKEKIIGEMLPVVRAKGDVVGRQDVTVVDLETEKEREAELVGLRYPAGPLGFLCLIVSEGGSSEVYTFYPHAEGRRRSTLVVKNINHDENGIEAEIGVSVPGADYFCFWDPLYFLDMDTLKEGEQAVFRLSAVAKHIWKKKSAMPLTEGTLFNILQQRFLEEHPDMDPAEAKKVPMFMPGIALLIHRYDTVTDLEFRVDDLEYFDCGRPMMRLTGVVMRSADQEIGVDVYASISALDGYVPSVGDDVDAEVWMQGVLDE